MLTQAEIEHLAALARLRLTPDEQVHFRQQLSAVLDYMDTLRQVDTAQLAPTATVLPLPSLLRADEIQPALPVDRLLANAPAPEADMFRVPPVLD